jgi:protease I
MELKEKKAAILVESMFNDYELWYPYYRLKEAGAEVRLIGPAADQAYEGKEGTKARSDLGAEGIDFKDYDLLVIPGGYAPDHMRRHEAMVSLVREMVEAGRVVAAICHAGWMLVSAGVLKGRTVTSFFAIKDDMVNAGATWVDEEVVQDGNLVTSRTPADLPAFMRTILNQART